MKAPRPAEREALEAAQRDFLTWLDAGWPQSERRVFTALRKAAKELHTALDPFLDYAERQRNPRNETTLLVLVQQRELHRHPHATYSSALVEMHARTLPLLIAACDVVTEGKERGGEPNHQAYAWVTFAAGHWLRLLAEEPKAYSGGGFWQAIEAFADDGLDARVPRPGLELVQTALKQWREWRELQQSG